MRILGWLAMALGIVGVVGGLLFAAGLWVVKPNIEARVDGLVTTADAGLVRAIALTDAVSSKLDDVNGRVADLKERVDALAAAPILDGSIATGVATSIIDFVGGPYAALRTEYAALRERATNVGENLRALDNAIPSVTLPGDAMEKLQALDARLVEIDSTVTDMAASAADGLGGPGIAARVSQRIADGQAKLAEVGQLVTDVGVRLQGTRDKLAATSTTVGNALTLGAIGTSLFGLYFAALNVLLFQQGRRWTRRKPQPDPAPEP